MSPEFRQALRALTLRPGFSILVILIMALCIGGNTAVFSAAKAVLVNALPFKAPDRLVVLSSVFLPTGYAEDSVSYADAQDFKKQTTLLAEISPYLNWTNRVLLQEGEAGEQVAVSYVRHNYLDILGIKPALGRAFTEEEATDPGSSTVCLISHGLWQRHFGRDPGVLGKQIELSRIKFTVIGVMPSNFRDIPRVPFLTEAAEIWLPAASIQAQRPGMFDQRGLRVWYAVGRMKPDATIEQLKQEMDTIATRLRQEYPATNRDYGVAVHHFPDWVLYNLRTSVKALLFGSLFVLTIGCCSVANLLLVRAGERHKEMSLRVALGAGRLRLIRQMLIESLVLALAGGLLGGLFAIWGTRLLASSLRLPPYVDMDLDTGVLIASFILTLLTGIAFGLPPALSASRVELRGVLQGNPPTLGARKSIGRNLLIVVEVASAVLLLLGSGLLLQSFFRLHNTRPDYPAERLLTLRVTLGAQKYEDLAEVSRFNQNLLAHIDTMPGLEGAAVWGPGTLGRGSQYIEVFREGASDPEEMLRADRHHVSPGAIKMLDIPLLKGRDFNEDDDEDAPQVAVIGKSMADTLWPNQDAIGKRFRMGTAPDAPLITVVGVIRDTSFRSRLIEREHSFLVPYKQAPNRNVTLIVRTAKDPGSMTESLRQAIRTTDFQVPIFDVATVEQIIEDEEAGHLLNASLMTFYAGLALLLAVLGLYAVLSHSVLQRTKEIGIRVSLGAQRKDILSLVMSRSMLLVGMGLAIGIGGGFMATKVLEKLLFGVTATDLATFVGVALVFLSIGLLATSIPARRALRVQPTIALKHE